MDTIKVILEYIQIFFLIYLIGYSTFLFLSVIVGSNVFFEDIKKKKLKNEIKQDHYVPVSIIVPAYNEEVTVIDTVKSLLNLNYIIYEIIVVDDGSKDDTSKNLIEYFSLKEVKRPIRKIIECNEVVAIYESSVERKVPITLITKENGGKADALNMGINVSKYPYFVCIDADSLLQYNALEKISVPIIEDEKVVAVGSMIQISNDVEFKNGKVSKYRMPKKMLPSMQVLEYERSFLASRLLLDSFNGNLIVSGAFGLFKKSIVIAAGGYERGSMGEDMELIVKLHVFCKSNKMPYSIKYAHEAICWTQAPEKFRDLMKQRRRWHIGLFQSMTKHKKLFFSFSYIYFLLYELASPLIEVIGILAVILASYLNLLNTRFMIIFLIVYGIFGAVLTIISFLTRNYLNDIKLRARDILKALILCIPENIFLRFILAWVRIIAILTYRGKKTKWGRIERKKTLYS